MVKLLIHPIQGMTALQRAEAISAELYAISQPPKLRQPEAATSYLFSWEEIEAGVVLNGDVDYVIPVHPAKDLAPLVALFPDLSQQEKEQLTAYINNSQSFKFGDIIPSGATIVTKAL